jgi:hypothetical protein
MKTLKISLKIFMPLLLIVMGMTACDTKVSDSQLLAELSPVSETYPVNENLQGTKWKLEGIVNEQAGEMQVLEPIDCEECYTLEFTTDTTAIGVAVDEDIVLDLSLLGEYGITDILSPPDADKFIRTLYSENTKSYLITTDSLKFINNIEGYYLLFFKLAQ